MAREVELAELAGERARQYWLLSGFWLQRPERPWLEELLQVLDILAGKVLDPNIEQLTSEARRCLEEKGAALELLREYTRLFRGLQEGYGPPPPYESLYRENRLMGDCTTEVLRHYREAGFGTVEAEAGPQDHLSAELKFLSLLCYREHEAWSQGDTTEAGTWLQRQIDFLDRHLLTWLPQYGETIRKEAHSPFYAAAMTLTEESVNGDRALLDGLHRELDAA